MDWSTFVPTLLATFAGVILSIVLSVVVYRAVNWLRDKRQAKETRGALLNGLATNYGYLKGLESIFAELKEELEKVEEEVQRLGEEVEKGAAPIWIPQRLTTAAYDIAFQAGWMRLIGRAELQRDLTNHAEECRMYNSLLQKYEEIVLLGPFLYPSQKRYLVTRASSVLIEGAKELANKTDGLRQRLLNANE